MHALLSSFSVWSCSGGGVGHGSEPVAVNRSQGSAEKCPAPPSGPRLDPPLWSWRWRRPGGLAGTAGARDWVRASRPQPESHTIPRVGKVCLPSHYIQQLGDDGQTCGCEGRGVCAHACHCVFVCLFCIQACVLLLTVASPCCNHM